MEYKLKGLMYDAMLNEGTARSNYADVGTKRKRKVNEELIAKLDRLIGNW